MLSVLIQLLSNRSQYVLVDSWDNPVNVASGVLQGSVFGQLLFLLFTLELLFIQENELNGSDDESKIYITTCIPTRVVGTCSAGKILEAAIATHRYL